MHGHVWRDGIALERYVGRWSRLVARELVSWLDVPASARWLDVGCGSGALTQAILDLAAPGDVTGIDKSDGYIAHANQQIRDPRTHFGTGDALALSYPNKWFDAAVSGLVLNFVPDKGRMIREMARVVQSGGRVGLYVWDYAGEMQMMRVLWDGAVALDPAAAELDEGRRFPVCHPGTLEDLFVSIGLQAVTVRAIDVPTVFKDFDDYWQPFLSGQGPAPSYVVGLSEDQRKALRERVYSRLSISPDGSIDLIARAWEVKGIVP